MVLGVWAVVSLIAAALGSIAAAAVSLPSLIRRKEEPLVLGDIRKLSSEPQRFDLVYEERQGWWSEQRSKIFYAFRDQEGEIVVLSSVCTHLGCTVRWESGTKRFICPCHGGVYSASGEVLAGPPPRSLAQLETELDGNFFLVKKA